MFTFYYTNIYTNHCIKETSIKQTKTTKQNKTKKEREKQLLKVHISIKLIIDV